MARTRVVPDAPRKPAKVAAQSTAELAAPEERDRLDDRLDVWAREIADLDVVTEGIVERIQHLAHGFDQSMAETLAASTLDRRAFQLLLELRSVGPPYRRSAGSLADDLRISSGAMT